MTERATCQKLFVMISTEIYSCSGCNKIALLYHLLGSHGQLQVRDGGLHCGVRSESSAKEDHRSCQERLRQAMGEMSSLQEGNNF